MAYVCVIQMARVTTEETVCFPPRDLSCILAGAFLLVGIWDNRLSHRKHMTIVALGMLFVLLTLAYNLAVEKGTDPSVHNYVDSALFVGFIFCIIVKLPSYKKLGITDDTVVAMFCTSLLTTILAAIIEVFLWVYQWCSG